MAPKRNQQKQSKARSKAARKTQRKPAGQPKEKSAPKDAKHDLYVGLLESGQMQRELLEARKNGLILLKRFEKLMLLREQRLYLEGELRSGILALSTEMEGLVADFPELPEEAMEKAKTQEKPPKPAPTAPPPRHMSEIDRKLAAIDQRLADLE